MLASEETRFAGCHDPGNPDHPLRPHRDIRVRHRQGNSHGSARRLLCDCRASGGCRSSFSPAWVYRLPSFPLRSLATADAWNRSEDPYPRPHPRSGRRGRDILRFPGAAGIFGAGGGGSAGAVLLTGCAQSLSIPSRVVVSVYQRVSPGEGSGPVAEVAPGDVVTARVQGPVAEGYVNTFTTILARSVSAIGALLV